MPLVSPYTFPCCELLGSRPPRLLSQYQELTLRKIIQTLTITTRMLRQFTPTRGTPNHKNEGRILSMHFVTYCALTDNLTLFYIDLFSSPVNFKSRS